MSTREEREQDARDGADPNCIGCRLGICAQNHDDQEADAP